MEQIQELLLNNIVPFLKDRGKKGVEPYAGYLNIVEKYKRILVHTEEGVFPSHLFIKRAPNETKEEFDYRKDNFKQITLPVFLDYLNTRGRAWHDSNWQIDYQEDDTMFQNETLRGYLESELYIHGSLLSFIKESMPKLKTQDPNGVLVGKPFKYEFKEIEGESIVNDQYLLEPTIYYYSCERVLAYKEDAECLIELDEKSIVEYNGKRQKIGYILEYHTPTSYYEIRQVGKYLDFKFEIVEILNHNFGQLLCTQLKGIPNIVNNKVVWESPFYYAVDNLDLALLKASNLFISESKCAYPVRVMLGNECDFFDGTNKCMYGQIHTDHGSVQCPSCYGTGLKNRVSPNGEILYNGKELSEHGVSTSDIIKYVAPDSTILEYLRDGIRIDIENARRILHLSTTSDVANTNSQTATFSNLENKALLSFVSQIATQEFDLYAWCIDVIGWLRYGEKYKAPMIQMPNSYDFTTEADYLALLKTARESNAPTSVLRLIIEKYISNIYFSKAESSNAFNLLMSVDRIFEYNDSEAKTKLLQGLITKEEEVIHTSGVYIIEQLYKSDNQLFTYAIEKQKQLVLEYAKTLIVSE